ncbi:Ribosome maturation factor RimP [Rhynchospora pubera]|uniref:Ribosome maturation factor RimP n=1 Tax=Rhynchospora pubera TaxID=906938 RepID=A0AAV8H0R2_9POAL|nr:Ribosome maturation factor RimP [Rhynchospora pubera]
MVVCPSDICPVFVDLHRMVTPAGLKEGRKRSCIRSYAICLLKSLYEKEDEELEEWEEEEETDPVIGDGGDGGGIVLRDVSWGERALTVAREVLSEHFGEDIALYAFKVSPKGYVYVRLDKVTTKYGCPDIEEIESFNNIYMERLDELVAKGEIPIDLALEVSSPGAERLLKVPEDLNRFKEMAMWVQYLDLAEDGTIKHIYEKEKEGIFVLERIELETKHCIWKLADVKENRALAGKGRPLSRKQKDWRLHVPFDAIKRVMLYLDSRH